MNILPNIPNTMNIVEYNNVDPMSVLHLTVLALGFPFTPEHAAHIRCTDPRPLPCFTVNAVEDDKVLGQMGVFRLPMVSREGREDVGGVWAVSTHPNYAGRGIASALLDEAHTRMRNAGLRFSTLGTDRSRVSHRLYQRHGYVDMNVWATALTRWDGAHQPTRLRAQPPGPEGYDFVEKIFADLASDYLGFAWRHTSFARLRDKVKLDEIWVLYENNVVVGYVFARKEKSIGNFGVWGWIGLILNLVFWIGLLAGLILLAVRAMRRAQVPVATGQPTAKHILQTRYVRGEITRKQYQQMLDDVR